MHGPATRRRWWRSIAVPIIWMLLTATAAEPATAAAQHPATAEHILAAPVDIVGQVHDPQHWEYAEEFPYFRPNPDGGGSTYVGKVLVRSEITLRDRTARWEQSILWMDGPALQRRIGWNCVRDNGDWFNSSCSNDWRYHTDTEGYTKDNWGRYARYTLGQGVYWFDFTFGLRAFTSRGEEAVWVAMPNLPMTSWHFRCDRRGCAFDRHNPNLT